MPASKLHPLSGLTVVHCHGCFDVPHIGHIRHLEQAKAMGDVLFVTITADKYVNKGPGRPFFQDEVRAESIASLTCVDFVAINYATNAADAIRAIKPTLFVKGPDYWNFDTPGLRAEKAALAEVGGRLVFTDGEVFHSTDLGKLVLEHA